jgi:hypothetical protein
MVGSQVAPEVVITYHYFDPPAHFSKDPFRLYLTGCLYLDYQYICNTTRSRLFAENIATVDDIHIRIISLIKTQKKGKKSVFFLEAALKKN